MDIKKTFSLIKGPKDNPIKLVFLRVFEAGEKSKNINVRLVRNTFKVPNKDNIYEDDLRIQLEFFFKKI